MNDIDVVKEYFEEARKLLPSVTNEMLCENGAVYYMNGNDGTIFDWDMNGHLCEFFSFYKTGNKLGFVKVFVNKNDTMEAYVYPDEGKGSPLIPDRKILPEGTALKLASLMNKVADKKSLYNKNIEQLDFNVELSLSDYLYDEEKSDF